MMKPLSELWRRYDHEYDLQKNIQFEQQTPTQKNASFGVYQTMRTFAEHIANEHGWKVSGDVLVQCLKWLQMTLDIRPYYGVTYVLLSHYHFFAAKNYVQARSILTKGIKTTSNNCIYDALLECVEMSENSNERWKLFVEWTNSKVLKLEQEGEDEKETPMMNDSFDEGAAQPAIKLNINLM